MTKRGCYNYKQNIVWLGTRYPTSTPPNFHNFGSFRLTERSGFTIFFSNKQTPPQLYWICQKVIRLLLWRWQIRFFCALSLLDCDRIFRQLLTQRTWTYKRMAEASYVHSCNRDKAMLQAAACLRGTLAWWFVCCVIGLRGDYFKGWPNKDKAILGLCLIWIICLVAVLRKLDSPQIRSWAIYNLL